MRCRTWLDRNRRRLLRPFCTARRRPDRGVQRIWSRNSPFAVTVPGAIDAWEQLLRDHGTRPLSEMLRPAIRLARDGYPITERVHFDWARQADFLRQDEDAVRFTREFLEAGKPVGVICHGPWTLIEADVVRGRMMTSWPSVKTDLVNAGANWVDEEVVEEEPIN